MDLINQEPNLIPFLENIFNYHPGELERQQNHHQIALLEQELGANNAAAAHVAGNVAPTHAEGGLDPHL
jgi:hypothetical protein